MALFGSRLAVAWLFPNYINVISVINITILSIPFTTIANIYASKLIASDLNFFLLLSYFSSIFIQYLMIFILVPIINSNGLGLALLISQICLATFTFSGLKKSKLKINGYQNDN